jgi:hypothetical protein
MSSFCVLRVALFTYTFLRFTFDFPLPGWLESSISDLSSSSGPASSSVVSLFEVLEGALFPSAAAAAADAVEEEEEDDEEECDDDDDDMTSGDSVAPRLPAAVVEEIAVKPP